MSNTTSRGRGGMGVRYLAEPLEQRHLLTALPLATSIESFNVDSVLATSGFFTATPHPGSAVGPNHVVNVVSTAIQWHTKDGVLQSSQRLGKNAISGSVVGSFFASVSPVSAISYCTAIYDHLSNRFVVLAMDGSIVQGNSDATTSRLLVAVSDDSDPNGTWYYTAIDGKQNIGGVDHFVDRVGLTCDPQGVYISATYVNLNTFVAYDWVFWGINKSPFYTGGAASVVKFGQGNYPGGVPVGVTPVQALSPLPSGSMMWAYTQHTVAGQTSIQLFSASNVFTSPTILAFNTVFCPGNDLSTQLATAPQLGTTTQLSVLDYERLENIVYRDDYFWACKTVAPPSGPDAGTATVHWYKFTGGGGAVVDHGSVGGEDIAPDTRTFLPSIMVNAAGDMALGFSASGPNIYPGAYFTGRLATDPPGTTRPVTPLAAGVDYFVRDLGFGNRWGIRSSIAPDPSDDNVVWIYNEYAVARGTPGFGTGDGRWATRNGKILFPTPGGISGASFWDHNFSGSKNAGEPGLAGVTVWLDLDNDGTIDSGEPTTTSAGDGTYSFSGLTPDTYNVRQIVPADYFATSNPRVVTVPSGAPATGADMGAVATTYTGTASADNYTLSAFGEGTVFFIAIDNVLTYWLPQNIPALTFNLGGGTDTLTLDQTTRSANLTFTATAGTIQLGILPITHTGVESISLVGGHAADTFNITTTSGQPVTVNGGPGTDIYNAINTGGGGPVVVVNGAGGDVLNVNTDNAGSARVDVGSVALGAVNVGNLGLINVLQPILITSTLSMNAQARINLNNNNMIVDYTGGSPLATIQSLLTSGYAGGGWGGFGIRTSDAFAGSTTSLGYAEATSLFSTFPATFAGQQVDNTSILIRYTLYGDADLNGHVNVNDLGILASNWQQSPRRWSEGNFDFNAITDINDLGMLATNWQQQLTGPASMAPIASVSTARKSIKRVAIEIL